MRQKSLAASVGQVGPHTRSGCVADTGSTHTHTHTHGRDHVENIGSVCWGHTLEFFRCIQALLPAFHMGIQIFSTEIQQSIHHRLSLYLFTQLTLKSVYHPAVWCNQPHRRISSNLCFSYSLYFPAAAVCSGVKNFIHYGIRSRESDTPVRGSRKQHPGGTTCGDDEGCRRDFTSTQIKSLWQWRAKGQHKSTAVGCRSEKDPAKQKSGQ